MNSRIISKAWLGLFLLLFPSLPHIALATTEYAKQTGFECIHCHVDATGGGELTPAGRTFLEDLKAKGLYRRLSLPQRVVRLIVGYLHLMAAIMWFGTILYVHLLLKPAYASKGLPRGELRLGWLSMIAILITGVILTIMKVPSWDTFITTRYGILLGVKILLFLVMFFSAVIVTLFIGPKLRKQKSLAPAALAGDCTVDGLCQFDGKEGRPAYIAYQGNIYDVTSSRLWKNGTHVMKHAAGNDLTDVLKNAPHGEDKVLALPRVGRLLPSGEKSKHPFHVRLFYFFAYMNLIMVFVITFVVALWRWWQEERRLPGEPFSDIVES